MKASDMHLDDGEIFAVPIGDAWLVHAPRFGVTVMADAGLLTCLKERWYPRQPGQLRSLMGLLSKPPCDVPVRSGPFVPDLFAIIPTRTCNLSCVYCAFGGATARTPTMEESFALKAVDWSVARATDHQRSSIEVHFFGGEPLLAPALVEAVVKRTRRKAAEAGLSTRSEVATNGCFSAACGEMVGACIDDVILSLDGPPQVHNAHRPCHDGSGTYDTIARNARIIGTSAARLHIRACVTSESVRSLDSIARWFCTTFQPASIDFEPVWLPYSRCGGGLHPPEPWEFARMVHKAARTTAAYGIPTVYAAAIVGRVRRTFCLVGRDAPILSPEGYVDACYLPEEIWRRDGVDMRMGRFAGDGRMALDDHAVARVRNMTETRAECATCFCRWSCAGGCHVTMRSKGNDEVKRMFCIQTRILTVCFLLDRLGEQEAADRLLADMPALQLLALRKTDTLRDWECA